MQYDSTKFTLADKLLIVRVANYVLKEPCAVSANVYLPDAKINIVVDEFGMVGEE